MTWELLRPFAAVLMQIWPVSTRVDKPENDHQRIIERIQVPASALPPPSGCP
jgi:putative SOS response-associated peptidase YedK